MIKVVIKTDESSQKITSIEVKGHSGKDVYGKDLVCAAVSAVVTGGMNALQDKEYSFLLEEGHAYIKALDIPSDYDAVVLKTIEIQLQTIEESDPEFIKIEIL